MLGPLVGAATAAVLVLGSVAASSTSPARHLNLSRRFGIDLEHGLGAVPCHLSKVSNRVPHGKGMRNKGMPLGIETTWFKTAST